jgi:hypothetical protein
VDDGCKSEGDERLVKSEDPTGMICFCFKHSRASIEDDIRKGGDGPAAQIREKIKQGQCSCESLNP